MSDIMQQQSEVEGTVQQEMRGGELAFYWLLSSGRVHSSDNRAAAEINLLNCWC